MNLFTITISIIGGLSIELFFRLIKYRDETNKYPPTPKYRSYDNYITVNEFVAGGHKRWWKYLIFRSLPPLVIFIFISSIYQKYFPNTIITSLIVLSAIISLIPREVFQLFKRTVSFSEKLMHFFNIVIVLLVAFSVSYAVKIFPINFLAPSVKGMVDNLWTSLLIAFLVIFYLDATNQKFDYNEEERNLRDNSIITIFNRIQKKFGVSIRNYCQKNSCSEALLFAIVIYEDMNRPFFIRKLENILVRIFNVELTVGIAQVKSKKPLTDEESIKLATENLRESRALVQSVFKSCESDYTDLRRIIALHNKGDAYADSIIQILYLLERYAEAKFN